jgi:hypothetical protein
MANNWISLLGKFESIDNGVMFFGEPIEYEIENEPKEVASVGIALISERFSGGTISATMDFAIVEDDTACEIVIYYDPNSRFYVTAGLGGGDFGMFTIRHFDGTKWITHREIGDRANLRAGQEYSVKVNVRGSRVNLIVDNVNVTSVNLPWSLPTSQVGIFCRSKNYVTVSNFSLETQKPKAFVVMQFTSPYNELYTDVIKSVCQDFGIDVIRADEDYGPGVIIADVAKQIVESKVIIAEITPTNPNVYYEVGYAHALNKPTILIAEKGTKLPFDVSPFRILLYENSIGGKAKIEEGLRKHLQAIFSDVLLA